MTQTQKDAKRIEELTAQLEQVQKTEGTGKNPELEAKARQYARMGWMDVAFCLESLGVDKDLTSEQITNVQTALVNRKYDALAGTNDQPLGWQA